LKILLGKFRGKRTQETIIEENFPEGMDSGEGTAIEELATEEEGAENGMPIWDNMTENPSAPKMIDDLITMTARWTVGEEVLVSG